MDPQIIGSPYNSKEEKMKTKSIRFQVFQAGAPGTSKRVPSFEGFGKGCSAEAGCPQQKRTGQNPRRALARSVHGEIPKAEL